MKYYGIRQMCHGADHIFVFSEDEIEHEIETGYLEREDFEKYFPDNPEEETEIEGFPWGGSNVSAGVVVLLENEGTAYNYLIGQDASGPDLEDPCLVDMAEYYWKIEVHDGCAGDILRARQCSIEKIEENAMSSHDQTMYDIEETLGKIDFYSDKYRDIRVSDVYLVKEVMDAVEDADLEWKRMPSSYNQEVLIKIPKVTANHMLMADGFNIFVEKEMPDKTYLHIEKDENGEISWDIIEHAGENTLNKLTHENNSFVREQISKIVADAVEKIEQKDEVER